MNTKTKIIRNSLAGFVLILVSFIAQMWLSRTLPPAPVLGLQTHVSSQEIEQCHQACTVSNLTDNVRSSATIALLDTTHASVPPTIIFVTSTLLCMTVVSFLISLRRLPFAGSKHILHCLWRL